MAASSDCAHGPPSDEGGFGLIELLVAMTVLNVALLAIMGVFSSGVVGMGRAERIGTAGTIADTQIEQYRAFIYQNIGLKTSGTTDSTYLNDVACPGHSGTCSNVAASGCSSSPVTIGPLTTGGPNPCAMTQTVTGADNKSYRLDTYIASYTAPTPANGGGAPRAEKVVTVVVRDPSTGAGLRVLARTSASFDCATGGSTSFNSGC